MKRMIILGAGQMGRAILRLINPLHYQIEAFADNAPALQGTRICALPVYSVAAAVAEKPDCMLISVADELRCGAMEQQLEALGYRGDIKRLSDYCDMLDARGAVLSLLSQRIASIPGDLAELGVYQGDFAARINSLFENRTLYLFDTFEGFDARDVRTESSLKYSSAAQGNFSDTSTALVLGKMPFPQSVVIRKGYFPDTAAELDAHFALVSMDVDLYTPTLHGLRWFYQRMNPGGVILLHDYNNTRFSGVKAAVDQFEAEQGRLLLVPVCDLHGSVMILKP